MGSLEELLGLLWNDYASHNKQAEGIYNLLKTRGETVINDHIAFRTFNLPEIGIEAVAKSFIAFGYVPKGEYHFKEKKLYARHFEHAQENKPKIFISELKTEEFSHNLRNIIHKMTIQVDPNLTNRWDFCVSGVPWEPVKLEAYNALKKESEYAAWLAAFGFRANHFTILVNALKTFKDLAEFNIFIKGNGYTLNTSGGEIKGSPEEFLEQSSTMAHPVEVQFAESKQTIPGCYYEFARRYPRVDGKLFTGFVAQSADKIFESTDNK